MTTYRTPLKPKPGARATRADGRDAYLAPVVRHKPPLTNAEWRAMRERARKNDIFETLFGRLLEKVKR